MFSGIISSISSSLTDKDCFRGSKCFRVSQKFGLHFNKVSYSFSAFLTLLMCIDLSSHSNWFALQSVYLVTMGVETWCLISYITQFPEIVARKSGDLFFFLLALFILHSREIDVSLCFGREVRTRLGVAISRSPVFHIKVGRPVKCLAQGHNKRTCRLVLHNLP